MRKQHIILFDLDGTLIDSTEAILESFYYAFKKHNFSFDGDDETIKQQIGYPLDKMFGTLGVDKDKVWDFVASYKEHYREISDKKTVLLPNATESVKLASSFATLGVVTTKTTKYSQILLEHLGILNYFDILIGREDVENPKPHPEPIFKALDSLNVTPSKDIFMIGDTKLDIISAKEAGITPIAVLCGYGTKKELEQYGCKIVTNSMEAVKLIENNIN